MKNANFFNFSKINIFILLNCILILKRIESLPYFQAFPTNNNNYCIVFSDGVMFFNNFNNNCEYLNPKFKDEQKILKEDESKRISFNNFNDDIEKGLLIVKDYLYVLNFPGIIFCSKKLDEINLALSVVVPIECNGETKCYYVVALKNSNNKLELNLYENDGNSDGTTCNSQLLIPIQFN